MLMAPTGFGKTLTAAHIIQRALDKGKRVAFTVPSINLIDQTVAAFEAEGIHCHRRPAGRPSAHRPRSSRCKSAASKRSPGGRRLDVDLVLVDEAHGLYRDILRWMQDCPDLPFIGLSATPWTRGLGKYYDDLIVAATTADLIRDGFLSPFTVYAPSNPDLSSVSTVAGDFKEDELSEAMDRPSITGDIVAEWLKRGEDRQTLAFCVDRKHAQHVHERFEEVGVAIRIHGRTDRLARTAKRPSSASAPA